MNDFDFMFFALELNLFIVISDRFVVLILIFFS
jgi:hypothetical protein